MALVLRTDRTLIRAGASSTRYLLASYTAPEAPLTSERLPINLALVLDRSGSMASERKFDLARQAVERALAMLRPEDRFALVVYDDQCETLMPSTWAKPEAKRGALALLRRIEPRGSTDLCGGWIAGCEQTAPWVSPDRMTRVLLLTDGQANHGTTDPGVLASHAVEMRGRGIVTSTFGVGADFDERLLEGMSYEGGGHAYFVGSAPDIAAYLTSEIGEALAVVARGTALEVEVPAGATVTPLNRYRHAPLGGRNGVRVELGDLTSGEEVRALLRVQFAKGEADERATVEATLSGDGALMTEKHATLVWTYADHAANDRQPRDLETTRLVAALYATRARAEATEANRHGDLRRANRVLSDTADRIASYALGDVALQAEVVRLRENVGEYADQVMSSMDIKASFLRANSRLKGRGEDGRASRRPER